MSVVPSPLAQCDPKKVFLIFCRYFTKMDLRDLFMLDNPRVSTTQRQIEELHAHQRKTDTSLDAHIAFLMTLGRL